MSGFLLDTNHVWELYQRDPAIIARLKILRQSRHYVCTSTVVLGEIEAGHAMNPPGAFSRAEYVKFIEEELHPNALPVEVSTRLTYAAIMGHIWRAHPPANKKIDTEDHLRTLKVDINDVWNAAIALDHNLVLVTKDKMPCIKEALKAEGAPVPECWIVTAPSVSPSPPPS